uniref:Lin-54 DREAM MuvB core complex component n=1 Tax=Paramormyrops kingsleyae TaxID=1676925 RepID=A0A3B3QWY7_9TELE
MNVVSPELNSLLPDEIMDTEAIVMDELPAESTVLTGQAEAPAPMETELSEMVALTTSTTADSTLGSISTGTQLLLTSSGAAVHRPATPSAGKSGSPGVSSGLQKLSTPFAIPANHQIILNKVSADTRSPAQAPKQEGQKLVVTTLPKGGQPIMLTLSHTGAKAASVQGAADAKAPLQQFQVVTIGGRADRKPVMGVQAVSTTSQLLAPSQQSALQAQQLKTVQIAKKTQASPSGQMITKFIITKPLNSKGLSGQTSVSPVIPGRVLPQNPPGTPPQTIASSETATLQSMPSSKIAISPLKSPSKTIKPVQTVAVGGVGTPQYKTIIPLATPPNVQPIQVPGSRFHYVRLVTATTSSGTGQTGSPNTNSPAIQTAKPVVVNTAAVRMSVPLVPAQPMKQVVPKPLSSSSTPQVVTSSQSQQRLIMPATALPQIQPNLTNLPPGTVLAPAPGGANVGYTVLPAQYVTQLQQSPFVTLASSTSFSTPTSVQTQARLSLNGHSKGCNCKRSGCLKNYCECYEVSAFLRLYRCRTTIVMRVFKGEHVPAAASLRDRLLMRVLRAECVPAKIMCSSICKCVGCKNFEESLERKSLMHLADAAEVRVQQQTAAKTKLSFQISDLLTRTTPAVTSGGGKLPYTFVTKEVAEATCDCLIEQAEQAELTNQPQAVAERMILEEFGRCLMRIINSAGKAKADCSINC